MDLTVRSRASLHTWLKQLRVHQYAKNLLIFVPILTSQHFDAASIVLAVIAFAAFSLCASATYIFNDIIDVEADRLHPVKKHRPVANGAISARHAKLAAAVLLAGAFVCAGSISLKFTLVLSAYLLLTTAYSIILKQKMLVDVIALAVLYTTRVIAGAVAISVPVSAWLLAFSMFVFLCLALVKRYSELALRIGMQLPAPPNRNYQLEDLNLVESLAVASGFNAITIFALYINSPSVQELYAKPEFLWLICPILTYWIGRVIMLAHRRLLDEDPISFAIRDRISYIACISAVAVVFSAMWKGWDSIVRL